MLGENTADVFRHPRAQPAAFGPVGELGDGVDDLFLLFFLFADFLLLWGELGVVVSWCLRTWGERGRFKSMSDEVKVEHG